MWRKQGRHRTPANTGGAHRAPVERADWPILILGNAIRGAISVVTRFVMERIMDYLDH
jgi:hypothetical protein